MTRIWYLGPESVFTMRSNSMPSGNEYVFVKGTPTEVPDKEDVKKLLKHNFTDKDPSVSSSRAKKKPKEKKK